MTDKWVERIVQYEVTWANLCKHVDLYGLDNATAGYRGAYKEYTNYKAFKKDSATEAAMHAFAEDTYIQFVQKYGDDRWEAEARADYQKERGV